MHLRYLPAVRGKHLEMLAHAALGSSIAACSTGLDIVHVHACGPALFAWLPRLTGKAVVCTLHGQDWRAPKWSYFARAGLKAGERAACALATKTIVVSETYREHLRREYGADPVHIPNGVSLTKPLPLAAARVQFGLETNEYLVSVGRLTPGKNTHQLIEAFRSLPTSKRLVIVGGDANTGDYVAHLKSLAGSDGRIIFTGPLSGDLLTEVFSNAYMFVFPTEHEGMPVALLEALAYGVPALVSDIAPNLEVIRSGAGTCGLTFRTGSVVDLASAIARALDSPEEIARFRADGPALVERRYDWGSIAGRTLQVYLEALERAPERQLQ
jgi:glycosyltransferase involved in cell wall biosynthesis